MSEEIEAKIIGVKLDTYILHPKNNLVKGNILATLRGNVKRYNKLIVGDEVIVKKSYDKYMIEKILPRKNFLVRPPVSNIDKLVIMLSIDCPSPDYILLDKELVLCDAKNIVPIICVNKIDLANKNELLKNELIYIAKIYETLGIKVIYTSALDTYGIDELKKELIGKTAAFSGNSGVGKSSVVQKIINSCENLYKDEYEKELEIGAISSKTNKGRHTTRHIEIYEFANDSYILDTPGFSSYELYDIEYTKLKDYYSEFRFCNCMYEDCMHVNEGESVCDVKVKVKNGDIDKGRYERYLYIYSKLKEVYDKKYR
ncbi:MAG: ribosome small subunit-dependent GTPase A [Clostridia bacterium]